MAEIFTIERPSPLTGLEGRVALCRCGASTVSALTLPGFEFRGDGSFAARQCRHCGYAKAPHEITPQPEHLRGVVCSLFQPRGPQATDVFVCWKCVGRVMD